MVQKKLMGVRNRCRYLDLEVQMAKALTLVYVDGTQGWIGELFKNAEDTATTGSIMLYM